MSCGKENMNPVFNDFPLIGTWILESGSSVLNIENLDNKGTSERYYEFTENGRRYLRRTRFDMPATYQIIYIDGIELRLSDKNGTYRYLRASPLKE